MGSRPKKQGRRNAGGLWVSADLALRLKGPQGSRGVRLPQSPLLDLADRFLGHDDGTGATTALREPVDELPPPPPAPVPRTPRATFPKPPVLPYPPKPPRLALPKPPARPRPPKPPKLNVPKLRRREP